MKKLFNWSLCLAFGGLMAVSCQQDIENVAVETTDESSWSASSVDYSAYANDPRSRGCRIVGPNVSALARGAAYTPYLWEPGQTVTVSFIGGTEYLRGKVEEYAKQWEEFANITLDFVESDGMLRVAFIEGAGSYSYIGDYALEVPSSAETMNFGWFDENSPEDDFSSTILHEFGHALGLIHEHQHPEADLNWNEELVYWYYSLPPNNLTREEVDINILGTYDPTYFTYNDYDVNSIMHYQFLGEFFEDGQATPYNTELSDGDKEIAGIIYPF